MTFLSNLVFEEVNFESDPTRDFGYANLTGVLPSGDHFLLESDLKYFPDKEFLSDYLRRDVDESIGS